MRTTRIILGSIIVAALSLGGYWGYLTYLAPVPPTPTPRAEAEPQETGPALISAEGQVIPLQFVHLSFSAGGLVEEVFVTKGEFVEENQLLARLENQEQLQAAVTAAELDLIAAQQALDELYDSNDLMAAQAQQTIAQAREDIDDAEWRLRNLSQTADQTDIDRAYANMILAEDELEKAIEDFEPYEDKPEDDLTRANYLSRKAQAQADYDATVRLYNALTGLGDEIDIAKEEAKLALAQAQLTDAQRDNEILQHGPDPDDIELAEARVTNAQAQLEAAQAAHDDLELRAPFAGTLISFDVKEGETVVPGAGLALLADISAWQVETTDLAEGDVALLHPGMVAAITLDAFPAQEFRGVIAEIDLQGRDHRGSVTYPVTLDFDPEGAPVRWGMTAFVDVELP